MDQGDAELGAHQREMLRAVIGAVVHVQALWNAAAHERLLEYRQERLGVLRHRKCAVGNHAGGIVEEGDEIALAPCAPGDCDAGTMHDIAHPELAGMDEGEAPPILVTHLGARFVHQTCTTQEAVHGGGRQRARFGRRTAVLHGANQLRDREVGLLVLQAHQCIGHRLG